MHAATTVRRGARTGRSPGRASRAAVVAVLALAVLAAAPGTAWAVNVTISPNPPSIHAGQNVVFTATPDTAVDSASYTWTFQGTPTTGGATYDTGALAAGTYTVSVQMSYTIGGLPGPDQPSPTVTFTVTPNNAPTVKITSAPQTANVGGTYTLTAAATDP